MNKEEIQNIIYNLANSIFNTDWTKLLDYIKDLQKKAELGKHYKNLYSSVKKQKDDVVVFAKKETQENMDKHIEHLRTDRFPEHYGMLECNVLVRRNCPVCKNLMKEWWKEFLTYSKRDQISMPYVLYKNGISIDEVGTLGNNVYENPSFRIVTHN